MKKHLLYAFCLLLGATFIVGLTACNDEKKHEHTYSTEWTMTVEGHYKKATCTHLDERAEWGSHIYGTENKKNKCTICGYKRTLPSDTTIHNVPVSDYTVVYRAGNNAIKAVAEKLSERISDYAGENIACVSDATADTGNEILIGVTNRRQAFQVIDGSYTISEYDDSVLLAAENTSGLIAAAQKLADDVSRGSVDYSEPVSGTFVDLTLRVMSYNIRATKENRWHRLKNVITRNNPDILGTQECSSVWQNQLKTDLPEYAYVGEGRDGANTEACFILYKKDKFELVESGTQWFSTTPTVVGSRYENCTYTRIFTYAKFLRKFDGMEFVHINTHMDLNQCARMKAVEQLVGFTANNYGDVPVFITGDFNTGCNQTYIDGVWKDHELDEYDVDDYLTENGFDNARFAAFVTSNVGTFPTNMYPNDKNIYSDRILDYCFITGNVLADKYHVDRLAPNDSGTISGLGTDASDHYPIVVETTLYRKI